MKTQNSFNYWNDFLSFKGQHSDRIKLLKNSILHLNSPNNIRQLVWVAIVDPDFSTSCLNFIRKSPPNLPTSMLTEKMITNLINHEMPSELQADLNREKIVRILRLFALKRPDISISFGMQYIASVFTSVFAVEVDAFIMFCYVYEVIYPAEFFYAKNRYIGLHQELRIFALMAEKMRPKLLNCLNAVYKENSQKINDTSPFVTLMKNIAQVWFKSLFVTMFKYKTLLRFFDIFLVFGLEFLHRFGLAYLSMKEKFLINSIKSETKGLKLGFSSDALIIAGNLTKFKLLQKTDNVNIEVLIKKCLKKETYLALNRFDYLSSAVILESKTTDRLNRIKKAKSLLKKTPLEPSAAMQLIKSFDQEIVTRQVFLNNSQSLLNWSPVTSHSIFSLFDENGEEKIEKLSISIGICLMVESSIDQSLELCFNVFDTDNSGYLSSSELLEMIIKIESSLDGRSSFYTRENESLLKILDHNNDSKVSLAEFASTVKTNKIFHPVIQFLQLFSSDPQETNEIFQDFLEIHSPLSFSAELSVNSSLSEKNNEEIRVEDLEDQEDGKDVKLVLGKGDEFSEKEGIGDDNKEKSEESKENKGKIDQDAEIIEKSIKVVNDFKVINEEIVIKSEESLSGNEENMPKIFENTEKISASLGSSEEIERKIIDADYNMHVVEERLTEDKTDKLLTPNRDILPFKHQSLCNNPSLESQEIDIPEKINHPSDRSCSRLCTKQSCNIF